MNGVAESVGGVADHVHLLASLRPTHRIADVLRDLKKDSTNWVRRISMADSSGKRVTPLLQLALQRRRPSEATLQTRKPTIASNRSLMS
jgi:REP element-mobilizing transposase RayT